MSDDAHRDVERRLQDTVGFLGALLESVGEAVVACDSAGRLTLFNRAARRVHGAAETPVGPEDWASRYDLYRADGTTPLPVGEIPLHKALRGEHVHDAEIVVAPEGHEPRWMLVGGAPIIDDSGRRHGAVVSMRDVTAARRAEAALRASRRDLRALIEHAPEAICVLDAGLGRFVTVNAQAERLFGMPRPRLMSVDLVALSPRTQPDGRDSAVVASAMVLRALGGETPQFEWTFVTATGEPVLCEVQLLRLPGERDLIRGSLIDIRERKEREAALRTVAVEQAARMAAEDSGRRLHAVLEQMPAGVMITDASGALVMSNPRVADILGRVIPAGALPGDVLDSGAFYPDGTPMRPSDWPLARALATGAVVQHEEIVFEHTDGGRRTMLASAAPIRDGEGSVVAGVVSFQDVTARAAAEGRLRSLQELSSALSGALSAAEVAAVAGVRMLVASGASRVWVARVDRTQGVLERMHASGYPPDMTEGLARLPLDAAAPLAEVARRGEPLWIAPETTSDLVTGDLGSPWLRPRAEAAAVLPLVIDARVIGCVELCFAVPQPFDQDTRLYLLTAARLFAEALERARRYERERDASRLLQLSLLPSELPADAELTLATRYLPAAGTLAGGDFYDAVELGDGRLALVCGDVVGHGIEAAAIMGQLRSAWRSIALDDLGTVETLRRLSRFAATVPKAEIATAVCAVIEPDGEFSYSCAGHPPPLRVGGPQGAVYLLDGRGPPLATDLDRYQEGRATLAAGEAILLYTDGVIDRRGTSLDDGLGNLARLVSEHRHEDADALLDSVVTGLCSEPQDDCALLLLRRSDRPTLRLTIPAGPSALAVLREQTRNWLHAHRADEGAVEEIVLSLNEAVANAIEHGYRDDRDGNVDVTLARDLDGAVAVVVRDRGRWGGPSDPAANRGRGLPIIRALMDEVHVTPGRDGTTARMRHRGTSATGFERPALPADEGGVPGLVVTRVPPGVLLTLHGDVDADGAARVAPGLTAAIAGDVDPVTLDLGGVAQLGSTGVRLVFDLARRLESVSRTLEVVAPRLSLPRRVLEIVGFEPSGGFREHIDAAITAIDTPTATRP